MAGPRSDIAPLYNSISDACRPLFLAFFLLPGHVWAVASCSSTHFAVGYGGSSTMEKLSNPASVRKMKDADTQTCTNLHLLHLAMRVRHSRQWLLLQLFAVYACALGPSQKGSGVVNLQAHELSPVADGAKGGKLTDDELEEIALDAATGTLGETTSDEESASNPGPTAGVGPPNYGLTGGGPGGT